MDKGYPLYFDTNHLNRRGAFFVGPVFAPVSVKTPAPFFTSVNTCTGLTSFALNFHVLMWGPRFRRPDHGDIFIVEIGNI